MAKKNSKQTKVEEEIVEEEVNEVVEEKPQKKTKKETKPKEAVQKETKPKEQKEPKEATKKKTKKVKEEVQEEENVTDSLDESLDDAKEDSTEETSKKRVVPTRDTILASFEEIIASVENEIAILRESKTKTKGIKFLRSLNKKLKTLKNHSSRVIKQRNSTGRKTNNVNSGFLKPVQISTEMAKFTGWNVDEPKSRVDVTKYICNYIKEHELQNPKDKRQIIADSKLSKLLNYDPKKDSQPLTYYRIQSFIKPHFIKSEGVAH